VKEAEVQEELKHNDSESEDIGKDVAEEGPVRFEPRFCTKARSANIKGRGK
jgi:hypothetical protein